jgi:transcriptional regulator with XRE-family HTH domain
LKIADLLRHKRKQSGLLQLDLALRSGISQSMISRLESNSAENVSIEVLRKLAHALNCALIDLLPDNDKQI